MGRVKVYFFYFLIIITLAVICIVILEEKNHDNCDTKSQSLRYRKLRK